MKYAKKFVKDISNNNTLPGLASGSINGTVKQFAIPNFSINFPDKPSIIRAHIATPSDLLVCNLNTTYIIKPEAILINNSQKIHYQCNSFY